MASIERTFSLHVPSSTENLPSICDFVKSIGTQAGMDDMEAGKLEMAVDEACSNVIEHAYKSDSHQRGFHPGDEIDENSAQIEVIDTGKGFDPSAVEQLRLEELVSAKRTGGLGMRLMKSFMDEVHYEMLPGVKNEPANTGKAFAEEGSRSLISRVIAEQNREGRSPACHSGITRQCSSLWGGWSDWQTLPTRNDAIHCELEEEYSA